MAQEKINILFAESQIVVQDMVSRILQEEGYNVFTAVTGVQAIEEMSKRDVSLAIISYELPDQNGLEVARELKKIKKGLNIIISTNQLSLELAAASAKEGITEYLTKPIERDQLLETVGKIFEKKRVDSADNKIIADILAASGNRYILSRKIGIGGFATVYRAWAQNLDKFVAIKRVNENISKNAKFLDIFREEAVITAKLEHENIVQVIDFLKTGDNIYHIVMEYVQGQDLYNVVKKASSKGVAISVDLSSFIIHEVLKAFDYAHSKIDALTSKPLNIIHQDVSPGNIMIYYDGRIKLTDFGIASAASRSALKTKGGVSGKIAYMSPEQAQGSNIDQRADLFALGIVYYELLAGKKLFEGKPEQIYPLVRKGEIDWSPLEARDIPVPLKDILKKALEKDRNKRYSDARSMLEDVKNYLLSKGFEHGRDRLRDFLSELMREEKKKEEDMSKRERMECLKKFEELQKVIKTDSFSLFSKPSPTDLSAGQDFSPEPGPTPLPDEPPVPAEPEPSVPEATPGPKAVTPVPPADGSFESPSPGPDFSPPKPAEDIEAPLSPPAFSDDGIPAQEPKERTSPPFSEEPAFSPMPKEEPKEPEVGGEKEKTVFDFVVDTAKKYKRMFILGSLGFFSIVFLVFIIDVLSPFTSMGKKIHYKLWPPALSIDTIPSKAKASLTDSQGNIIFREEITPIYIGKIQPGGYILKAYKEGYGTTERRITVLGDKGESISIAGAEQGAQNLFVVPFEVHVNIDSYPQGATVYIDNKKIPSKTPLEQTLSVGRHSIRLSLEGFEEIGTVDGMGEFSQCSIDLSLDDKDQPGVDYRYWDIEQTVTEDDKRALEVKGSFWKEISIESVPSSANIYIGDEMKPGGVTPAKLKLKVGTYKLSIEKDKFKPWQSTVDTAKAGDVSVSVTLNKWIHFRAYEISKRGQDINALVYIKGTDCQGYKTPFKFGLPSAEYSVLFRKKPKYKDAWIKLDVLKQDNVVANLEVNPTTVKITVRDSVLKTPIGKAFIRFDNKTVGETDDKGLWKGLIEGGEYNISVGKQGIYERKEFIKTFTGGEEEDISVELLSLDRKEEDGGGLRSASASNEMIESIFEQAKEEYENERLLKAYEGFKSILKYEPEDRGIERNSQRYIKRIESKLMGLIRKRNQGDVNLRDFHYALGFFYYQTGKPGQAIEQWNRVLVFEPQNAEIKEFIQKARGED